MNQPTSAPVADRKPTPHLDLYASSLALFCLLHCLAVPVLIASTPFAFYLAESHWLHQLIVLLAAPATLWVIYHAKPGHCFTTIALAGLGLLVIGAFLESLEDFERPITVVGSILLASAHLWHWHRTRWAASTPVVENETTA